MSPFNQRRKQNTRTILIRATAVVLGVVALVFVMHFLVRARANVVIPLYPDTFDATLMSKRALVTKVNELQGTLNSYNAHNQNMTLLENENTTLKAEFGRESLSRGTLAHVLTVPNRSFYDTFVIDAGSLEGISVDNNVYAFDAIALGVVSSVSDHSSVVTLFSAAGRETSGNSVGENVAVTLIGRGSGEYEVRMPRDVHFEIGSSIALQSIHPSVLATVQKIMTDPRDPFQRLLAKVPVNLTALKWVVVR